MADDAPVTFLLTDVEGSTRLWDERPEVMREINARHDALVVEVIAAEGGEVVRSRAEGDSAFAVFDDAATAARAALDLQRAVRAEPWAGGVPVRVRMALHTGPVTGDGQFYGPVVNRCARLRGIGHGGQTLLSSVTAALVAGALPEGASLVDHGEHRLKDLAQPEHVHEVVHPDLPGEFPPLRSLDIARSNLPRPGTALVGREDTIDDVAAALATHRLFTLTGPGGVGKTRVAVEAARTALDAYPDGVWLVDLAGIGDGALVAPAVGGVVGVRDQPGRPLAATLADHLNGRVLLVLDNCEHVAAGVGDLLAGLLPAAPGLRVLATSRGPLGVPGEHAHPLPPLDAGAAAALLVERAGSALVGADADVVTAIAARLDGLPLAIEMVAARAVSMPLDAVASSVADAGPHDALRSTIASSCDLLDDRARTVFRRLAPFAGGFTLEAAESVAPAVGDVDADDVLDAIAVLVAQSLVQARDRAAGVRYRMLESIRQFAANELDSAGEATATRSAHLRCYADLTVAARTSMTANTGDAAAAAVLAALDTLDAEHDNVRAALSTEGDADDVAEQVRMAASLVDFWGTRGYWVEGRRWLELVAARSPVPTPGRAQVRAGAGVMAQYLADYPSAEMAYNEALAIWRGVTGADDKRTRAMSEAWLSMQLMQLAQLRGDKAAVRPLVDECLRLSTEADWLPGMAAAATGLALVAFDDADWRAAAGHFDLAAEAYSRLGQTAQAAEVLLLAGAVRRIGGDVGAASPLVEEAHAQATALGNAPLVAFALGQRAELRRLNGDLTAAEVEADEALAVQPEVGARRHAVETLVTLARIGRDRGDREAALARAVDACELADAVEPTDRAIVLATRAAMEAGAGIDAAPSLDAAVGAFSAIPAADRAAAMAVALLQLDLPGDAVPARRILDDALQRTGPATPAPALAVLDAVRDRLGQDSTAAV